MSIPAFLGEHPFYEVPSPPYSSIKFIICNIYARLSPDAQLSGFMSASRRSYTRTSMSSYAYPTSASAFQPLPSLTSLWSEFPVEAWNQLLRFVQAASATLPGRICDLRQTPRPRADVIAKVLHVVLSYPSNFDL